MKYILLFILSTFFISCDPRFDASYYIDNQSDGRLTIILQTEYGSKDTSIISKGTKLLVVTESALGETTKKHLDNLKNLPFDSLQIQNDQQKEYNKTALDIENWEKVYPSKEETVGKVILTITSSDFD